jgi:pyruvate/2-oxoglutarate dehydrogenase complex dihydrolipoamide acyltransferase (E2) component
MPRHPIIVPDLGLDGLTLSLWLVEAGAEVSEGDRVVELLADGVTVDLSAPASGTLAEPLACEDDPVAVGQTLGVIEC